MKRTILALAATLLVATFAKPANADLILGGQLFYTGGEVKITVNSASAAFHSFLGLYLLGPTAQQGSDLGENHNTGATVTINPGVLFGYGIGDELIFGIRVLNTELTYFMGDGSRNPDGLVHAQLNTDGAPGVYIVGFEDLFGPPPGSDRDFNDNVFSFEGGVRGVPEPGTLLLFGIGLLGMGVRRRMKAAA